MRTTFPVHRIFLDLITILIFGVQYELLSYLLCNFLQPPITSSLSGPNALLSTLFSTPSASRCHVMKHAPGYYIKTVLSTCLTLTIIVLYRMIKKSLCSRKKQTFYFYFMTAHANGVGYL
jgi:hypothetical protein